VLLKRDITLSSLQRAGALVGRRVAIQLIRRRNCRARGVPALLYNWAMKPIMYPNNWLLDGTRRVCEYRAHFSPTDEVFIANFGAPFRDDWRTLRIKNGVSGDWMGNYASAQQALTAS